MHNKSKTVWSQIGKQVFLLAVAAISPFPDLMDLLNGLGSAEY